MRVRVPLMALAALTAIAAACGRTGSELPGDDEFRGPFPFPTYLQPVDYGSGTDGNLVVTSAGFAVNPCDVIVSTTAGGVLVLGTGGLFQAGDRVLLWQVQMAFASSGTPAPVTALDSAGIWQIVTVEGVSGTFVAVSPEPKFGFRSNGTAAAAQVCRIPQYGNVTINSGASIAAPAWSGRRGGFAGFYASGTLEILAGGAIDATGKGFAGGTFTAGAQEGTRGEGIDGAGHDVTTPKNLANGGGGGGFGNCGAGGGANGGRGGSGGGSAATCYGQAGNEIVVSAAERWVMGGGGGSGQGGSGGQGPGGAGGGVVFFRVRTLTGEGGASADGVSGGFGAFDGGGAGGAGGLLFLSAGDSAESSGVFTARGATGGGCSQSHGPGGGGGGGRAWVEGIPSSSMIVTGALNGTAQGVGAGSGPFGATNGGDGVVEPVE